MERNERKANSRNHSITIDRDSKFVLRKVLLDFTILFIGKFLFYFFIFKVKIYCCLNKMGFRLYIVY